MGRVRRVRRVRGSQRAREQASGGHTFCCLEVLVGVEWREKAVSGEFPEGSKPQPERSLFPGAQQA